MTEVARALCPPGAEILELTARGAPRWFARGPSRYFIPLGNPRVRRGGSEIYPAFRWRARAFRAALRLWVTAGGARFTHETSQRGAGGWPLGDLLSADMPTLSAAAVSVGIPGPGQKITVRLMDGRGEALGFAKYADKPYTRELLANEARMLKAIPEGLGPRLLRFTPFLEGDLLVQTALPGRTRVPRMRLDAAQMRFFERLVRAGDLHAAHEHPLVETLRFRGGGLGDALEKSVAGLGDGGWPVALTHGDMAPWNMFWWRGECLAFDWEHGREVGFPYIDAAAALIQVASIVRRSGPAEAKRDVCGALGSSLPARYAGYAPGIAALSAINMLVSWYPPRKPDAYERWLKNFVEAPA